MFLIEYFYRLFNQGYCLRHGFGAANKRKVFQSEDNNLVLPDNISARALRLGFPRFYILKYFVGGSALLQ